MKKGLENLFYNERLRELALFSLEKAQVGLTKVCKHLMRGAKKMEPDPSQSCSVKGKKKLGTNRNFCLNLIITISV